MKIWIKKIFGFGLASFFSDFSHEMTLSFVPILVGQFIDPAHVPFYLGLISSLTDAFASFLRIFSGYISDRISHKKYLIATGYFITALFSMLVGFSRSIWHLLIYRILSFTGNGLREPPRDALIAATISPMYYGRAFGLNRAMDTLGSLIGPLVAFVLISRFSMRSIFLFSFIPGVFAVCAIIFLTYDIIPTPSIKESLTSPLFLGAQKTSLFSGSFIKNIRESILTLPRSFIIFVIILLIFDLSCFNRLLLLTRAQEILVDDGLSKAQSLVLLYSVFNIARALSELFIGSLSDFMNKILLLAFLGCGLSALVAFLLINTSMSFSYCSLIFILAGISTASITTLKKVSAAHLLPEHIRGLGYGLLQASEGFGALFSNIIIGFLWTWYQPTFGFTYVIILSVTAMILLIIFNATINGVPDKPGHNIGS